MRDANQEPTEELVLLGQAGIPKPDIMQQVETLCHSPAFDDKDRARELLTYLVEEALAGRVPRPAEIALRFGKKDLAPDDSYVRSLARKLKGYLAAHYDTYAKLEEIRLFIPDREYFILAPRAAGKNSTSHAWSEKSEAAAILEPADRAEVYYRTSVRGRIDGLNLDLRVWLVVRAPYGGFYPQCPVSRNSPEWKHELRIGLVPWGSDEGAEYEINLVAANTDGDADFYNYIKSGRDGFGPLLPSDTRVLDTKRVTRRDIRPPA